MDAYEAIMGRRSLRQLDDSPVPGELLERLLHAGVVAPAPHHTRPWRYVVLETAAARSRLATAMGAAWRRDLAGDGVPEEKIEALLARSRRQIEGAPALVLACIVGEGLREWPDGRRRRAEWRMAIQSMGCALENMMVAAHALGLTSFWISAPLFCYDAVAEALELPPEFEPQALLAIGYPAPGVAPRPRPDVDAGQLTLRR